MESDAWPRKGPWCWARRGGGRGIQPRIREADADAGIGMPRGSRRSPGKFDSGGGGLDRGRQGSAEMTVRRLGAFDRAAAAVLLDRQPEANMYIRSRLA